jgi:hypothetical protein
MSFVAFTCKYRAATLDGVCDSDGFSRNPRELLSHEKRLREKTLQLASTRHGALLGKELRTVYR